MSKYKMVFNYKLLQTGDMVCCAGRSPFAGITRIVTSGWRNLFRRDIAVHTGMIVEMYGQKLIAEMQARGLELNSLERYAKVGGRRWVISIKRNNKVTKPDSQAALQSQIALDLRRGIEYDYAGLFEFVSKRIKDNKKRCYCSEYYYQLTRWLVNYPKEFKEKVSPVELQICSDFVVVTNAFR